MNEPLGYRIDKELKRKYDSFIEEKYGHKQNRCGKSIETLIKLELALNGNVSYSDDPEVQSMLCLSAEKYSSTHTHSNNDNIDDNEKHDTNDDEWKEKIEEKLAKVKEQLLKHEKKEMEHKILKEQSRYRDHSMDGLVSKFQEEYGDYLQVSYTDLSKLVMKMHGVLDKRSIHNRVEFLIANDCIEPFAPNVYNVKL